MIRPESATTVNLPLGMCRATDRQLLIAQDELTLTRETSVLAAEGSSRHPWFDALNGQSSSNNNEFQVIWREGVALYILDGESTRRF